MKNVEVRFVTFLTASFFSSLIDGCWDCSDMGIN